MTTVDPLPYLLTIDQVADRLGVNIRYVCRQVAEGCLPYIKVGRLVRFDPADIAEYLARSRIDKRREA